MSTRAMSRLPLFNGENVYGGGSVGASSNTGPSLGLNNVLATLLGQNQTTGGFSTDANGQLTWTPVAAAHPKGLFSGGARKSALEQNYAMGPQLMQNQSLIALQKLMNEHEIKMADVEQQKMKLQAALAEQLAKTQAVIELAKRRDVTPEELASTLAPKLTDLAVAKVQNEINANNPSKNPDIATNARIGANMEANRLPPNLLATSARPNTLTTTPAIPGVNAPSKSGAGSIQTAGPIQQQSVSMNQWGQMLPTSSVTPGGVSFPVNPKITAGALNLNPQANTVPNGNDEVDLMSMKNILDASQGPFSTGAVGGNTMFPQTSNPVNTDLSSFLSPVPNANPQSSIAPIPANNQPTVIPKTASTNSVDNLGNGQMLNRDDNLGSFLSRLLKQLGDQVVGVGAYTGR